MPTVDGADVAAALIGPAASVDTPLGVRTTYRVGGPAAVLVEAAEPGDLARVGQAARETGLPVVALGNGSNLLVADRGFPGIVVRLTGAWFGRVERDATTVTAGAAADLPVVARRTVAWRLTGFEWAVGVPGTIGGAVRMNAGGHGSDMDAVVASAAVADVSTGAIDRWPRDRLAFGYRRSALAPHHIVLDVALELSEGDPAAGERMVNEIVRWRREHQPGGQNAGSIFTNPADDSAGRLVDSCGLKGFRLGTASVSTKHANFIQADNGGRAADVRALIDEVRRRVADQTGVELVTEVRLLGFDDGGAS